MSNDTRIESLESQVRILKRLFLGLFALFFGGVLLAMAQIRDVPDVIRARTFEVLNKEGEAVAGITAQSGHGEFVLKKKDGSVYALIGTDEGKSVFALEGPGGSVALIAEPDGTNLLSIRDKKDRVVAALGNMPSLDEFSGTPGARGALVLYNENLAMKRMAAPANPTAVDEELIAACNGKDASAGTIRALLKRGADVNCHVGAESMTPLMLAVSSSPNPEVTKVLVQAGARLEARNMMQNTALMLAVRHSSNPEVVSVLLEAGAAVNVTDSVGNTVAVYARANKHLQGTKVLQSIEESAKK